MRRLALAAAAGLAALAMGWGASAAPAEVVVTIGPELSDKAVETYGLREIQDLAQELRGDVERALARTGAHADSRIELVLVDAKPNRPTMKQLGDKMGLSYQSVGVGGARIEGRAVARNGAATPLSYSWYETDIRFAVNRGTWGDAQSVFLRFARKLAHGDKLAGR